VIGVAGGPRHDPLLRVGYGLLLLAAVVGVLLVPAGPRFALLPAVVVFGWSQIGGV
jgi:hypothetical protein